MKKDPVTKEDVKAAVDRLIGDGKKVTQRAVLDAIGRGSFSTVAKYLAELEAEETNHFSSPPVRELMGKLWEQATAAAAKGFEDRLKAAQEERQEVVRETQRLETALTKAEADRELAQSQKDELISTLGKLTEEASKLRESASIAERQMEVLRKELSDAQTRHADARHEHSAALRAAELKYQNSSEKWALAEIEHTRSHAKLEQEVLRFRSEKDAADAAVRDARSRVVELMEENVQLRTRLDEERSRTDAIRGQLTARTEGLQDRLERVQTERLEIERSHARRISELEELLRRAIEEYSRKTQQQVSQTAEAPTSRAVAAEADALAGS